jgi:hypothetical protein
VLRIHVSSVVGAGSPRAAFLKRGNARRSLVPSVFMSASNGTSGLRSAGSARVRSTYKKATGAASSWFT